MRSSGNPGRPNGTVDCTQANNPERDPGRRPKHLYIVGIGPGRWEHLSPRALDVLKAAETVVGYRAYIDLLEPLIKGKTILSSGMRKEVPSGC